MTTTRTTATAIRRAADQATSAPKQCFEWSSMRHIATAKRGLDVELIVYSDDDADVQAVAEAVRFAGTVTISGNAVRIAR